MALDGITAASRLHGCLFSLDVEQSAGMNLLNPLVPIKTLLIFSKKREKSATDKFSSNGEITRTKGPISPRESGMKGGGGKTPGPLLFGIGRFQADPSGIRDRGLPGKGKFRLSPV